MQIIVKNGAFTYTYGTSVNDTIEGGFVEEYFSPVGEAIDAAMELLWNVYDKGEDCRSIEGRHSRNGLLQGRGVKEKSTED